MVSVVGNLSQGDLCWAELPDAGRRPVLVVTRDVAIAVLRTVVVAPVTRTIRGIPTEIALDVDDGMPDRCVASFDNLRTVPRWALTERVARLSPERRAEVCIALDALADC